MAFELRRDEEGYLVNPRGRVLGYCRVSTSGQKTDRQEMQMLKYGVRKENIITEYESGKTFNRSLYRKLIKTLRKGDVLCICSIDRLGRNYTDIIDQWRLISTDIGCGIHVIDMPALNTSGDPDDLLSKFITDMMLQVLSFVAENELRNIHARQAEGIAAAKRRGDTPLGAPRIKMSRDFWQVYIIWRKDLCRTKELSDWCQKNYGISNRTFFRKLDETHYRFKFVPTDELDTLEMSEYNMDWEHMTGNDDDRNSGTPEFSEHTQEEIVAEILEERARKEAELEAIRAEKEATKKAKKKSTGKKRGRPKMTAEDKAKKKRDANTIRTIIID